MFVILAIFVAVAAFPVVAWFNVGISAATNALKLGAASLPVPGPAYTKFLAFVPAKLVAVSALPVTSPVKSPVNTPAICPAPVIVGAVSVLFVNVCVSVN